MATNMRFSELTTASALADSDIFALAKLDGSSESGYMSYKATLTAIAIYLNKLAVYSSDLDTNDKHIIGAINELKRLISLIPQFNIVKVQVLPTEDISDTTIYLVPSSDPQTQNVYDEFIHIDNAWEQIGSTAIDLSDYYTKAQVDGLLATKANTADVTAGLALKENKADMQTDVKEIIESCYEEKTVTGNPITVKTISGSNAKALTVSMNPIQDLHGYDHPWAGGAWKNKFNDTIGTHTINANTDVTLLIGSVDLVADTTYTISCKQTPNTVTWVRNLLAIRKQGTTSIIYNSLGSADTIRPMTYTPSETATFDILVWGHTLSADTTYSDFQVEVGTQATTFAPYSNICPISGRTEVELYHDRCGVNTLYNGQISSTGTYSSNANRLTNVSQANENTYFLKAGTHTLSASKLNTSAVDLLQCTVLTKNSSYTIVDNFATEWNSLPFTFTTTEDAYLYFTARKDGVTALSVNDYKMLIDGKTYTHQYSETIYGGVDDFGDGGATVTLNTVDMGNLTYTVAVGGESVQVLKNNIQSVTGKDMKRTNNAFVISSIYPVNQTINSVKFATDLTPEEFKTLVTGQTLCYELAAPDTIETSAENISLLKGNNVVSTDGDNMELSYQEIPDITPLVQYVQTLEARIKALEEAE